MSSDDISSLDISILDISDNDITTMTHGGVKMPKNTDKGALTEAVYYILLALYEPTHGYGIIKFARAITNNRVILGSGTLYGAINTLLKNEWISIEEIQNDSRKLYVITDKGKDIVDNEIARLKELAIHGEGVTGGDIYEENIL